MRYFITLIVLFSTSNLYSEPYRGGEITWSCLANGKYVFYMKMYTTCNNAVPHSFVSTTIDIVGTPLPSDSSGTFSSIVMHPDSATWNSYGLGKISPDCDGNGTRIPCNSSGSIQMFTYQSDPVNLFGIPPASGWKFYHVLPGFKWFASNLNGFRGQPLLRSTMYKNSSTANIPCNDNSPQFIEIPDYLLRVGVESDINYGAIDVDSDSLVYSLDYPQKPPISNAVNETFGTGYSVNNPTPDTNFNSSNIPFTMHPNHGIAKLRASVASEFLINIRVDSYKNGILYTSVHREMPLIFLSGFSPYFNSKPTISIAGVQQTTTVYYDTVMVKRTLRIPIQVSDTNFNHQNNSFQRISLIPSGAAFTANFNSNSPCAVANLAPCAFLQNQSPVLNTIRQPNRYEIDSLTNLTTEFVWSTDCVHLGPNGRSRTHHFTIKAEDDFCPHRRPGTSVINMAITVIPDTITCNLITELNEIPFREEVSLFPNPTHGIISITLKKEAEQIEVRVQNIQGQLVEQRSFYGQDRFDLEIKAKAGIYFIELENGKGERTSLKVIKN